jgi:Tat protein translocase TatB subunit
MFDISLGEMALIMAVAVLVIGPKELPTVIKKVTGWIRQLRAMAQQITDQFSDVAGMDEIQKLRQELQEQAKFIRDAEGNLYRTYDISDMMPPPPIEDKKNGE